MGVEAKDHFLGASHIYNIAAWTLWINTEYYMERTRGAAYILPLSAVIQ